MKRISLNFFGETASVNLPTTLKALRKCIADQFLFDPADAAELVISYVLDFSKTLIQTDVDYKKIFALGVKELNLDISEGSKLYQQKKNDVIAEDFKLLAELDKMRKDNEALCEEQKKVIKDGTAQLDDLKAKIMVLRQNHKKTFLELQHKTNENVKVIRENEKKIEEMETKLSLPHSAKKADLKEISLSHLRKMKLRYFFKHLKHVKKECSKQKLQPGKEPTEPKVMPMVAINKLAERKEALKCCLNLNENAFVPRTCARFNAKKINEQPKAEEKQPEAREKAVEQKDVIHPNVICDGCRMFPLKGLRYKCACCRNFDYCAECEEKYSEIHQHPFVCIRNPKMRFALTNIQIRTDFPPFDKNIHN